MPSRPLPDSPEILAVVLEETRDFLRWYEPIKVDLVDLEGRVEKVGGWARAGRAYIDALGVIYRRVAEIPRGDLITAADYIDSPFRTTAGGTDLVAFRKWLRDTAVGSHPLFRELAVFRDTGERVWVLHRKVKARLEALAGVAPPGATGNRGALGPPPQTAKRPDAQGSKAEVMRFLRRAENTSPGVLDKEMERGAIRYDVSDGHYRLWIIDESKLGRTPRR